MGQMFPFCSHQKAGSRLADLRVMAAIGQGRNNSPRGMTDDGGVQPGSNHHGRAEMIVMGALQVGCVVLILGTTGVI
jgi:hypothetical protein